MLNIFSKKTSQTSRVYLDNAGATAMSKQAQSALVESLSVYGNPSGIHHEGARAGQLLDKARALCATVLNAHAYETYFVSSGTESCNLAVLGTYLGFAKSQQLRANNSLLPHIIVSSIEHPSVLEPVRFLERKGLIRVTYLPVYNDGIVRTKDIVEALSEETILVSVMYANNEIGTIQPIKEIGRAIESWKKEHDKAHTVYPYFHSDACQAANYCNLDVVRLRVHLMTVNSSKVYGPKGVALLYKREGIHLESITYGGGQERALRSGTESAPLAYSFGVALTEAFDLQEKESVRLRELRDYCKEKLSQAIPSIIFYGAWDEYAQLLSSSDQSLIKKQALPKPKSQNPKAEHRLPNNINCRIPGISSEEMILRLDAKGFAVSHKSACASMETEGSYVVIALGATESEAMENIRISLGRTTSRQDLDRLIEVMQEIAVKYR
jgi:cysteine desulfurase